MHAQWHSIIKESDPFDIYDYNETSDQWCEMSYIDPKHMALNSRDCKGAFLTEVTDSGFTLQGCSYSPDPNTINGMNNKFWIKKCPKQKKSFIKSFIKILHKISFQMYKPNT